MNKKNQSKLTGCVGFGRARSNEKIALRKCQPVAQKQCRKQR